MPYTAEHKARTRARIIEAARVLFNRRGFEQVSIDEIMQHAGLTRGGFYNHFASKDELYAEAIRSFTSCNPFARRLADAKVAPPPRQLARRRRGAPRAGSADRCRRGSRRRGRAR